MEHDHSYKLLFSHWQMVADLLRGFVTDDWVRAVDFTTLERVHSSHISTDLREREDDMLWRVRWQHTWLYVYLLLEFQSDKAPTINNIRRQRARKDATLKSSSLGVA